MINPREQAEQPRLRFNFDKAKQRGASDEDILEFLQSRDTNIDWGELETRSQGYQNPLAYKISTLAQNDWEFLPPKPQEAKEPSPSLESTPPSTTQEDFTPTLDKLENESALREIYRDLAPSFMLTKEMEQDNTTLQKAIDEAKEQGRAFSDLHPSLKQALRKRAHQEKSVFTNPLATPHDLALESYEKDLRDLHIAKKTPQELDQSDKDYIKSRASAWDKIFASDDEIYRDFIENKRAEKIVPKEMKTALEVLDNFHQYKSIASLLTGSDEKAKTDYLNSAHTIATNLGFEGIGVNDKGELFLNHKGEFYRINSGFFESLPTILAANAGSITGGIAGAFAGAARGAKLGRAGGGYGATAGAVVGGAVGAFGGGALDTILGNTYLHRETNAQEILAHATQEGVLNIVGDMAILGAIKAYDKLKGAGIAQSLGKIIDYTPVLGFVKRSQDGNQAMAQKLLSQTYTKEQEKSLQEASESFGLALEIGDHTKRIDTTNLPPKFKDAVDKVQDIFTLKNQQQFQSRLLQAIRADESGNLLGFITEAASKSPKAHNTLTRILHQTTQKLKRSLESIAPKSSLKAIFDELEKGTKDSYDEAITQILGTIYDDTYKVNLNTLKEQSGSQSFEAFKQSLADSGVAPESSANFLNFIEKNIYNPKGVSFTQLNNALKNLNAYYKNERDPNFKTHIKQAYDSFVRSDIKAGIESIFAQNKVAYNDAKTLFDTALLDYATMKDSLKLADRLKIRDRKNTNEKALQSLLDFAKGQGDKEANLDAITKALPQGARAHIEIAMLEELFRKSMLEVRDIQVFNSTKFLDNIKELKGTFTSKAAHDYINAAEKFHALFKNDPLILQAIKPATTDKIGSSIATTLEGAVKFQMIKGIFANMIRLLPHIPLLPSVNQKVQGAALRHHLSKALESSYNIGDLKLELTRLEKRGDFTNATKEHIRAFKGELDNARQEVLDIAKAPHALESTAPAQPSSRADEIGVAIHKEAPQETQKVDSSPKTSEIKQELLQRLKPILNKPLTNAQGVQAYINHASIDKMLSDKAIAKSVANGFSKQEHLEAVGDIERLFGISQEAATHSHKGDNPSVIIHRLNAPFKNANALITTKESLDKDKNRIYSVELELTPRFSTPVRPTDTEASKGSLDSLNGQGGQDLPTIAKAKDEREMTKSIDSSDFTKGETLPLNSSADSTTQSLMQQAKQEALAKQEQQAEQAKAKELAEQQTAQAIKDHNDQIQAQKDARVGKGEMDRDIHIGPPIEVRKTSTPSTSIATDDDNIYQLDFVIVKAHAVKPNFSSDGLQPRTQKEHKTIESIAQNFKPEMVLGRGGYKDLPIIAKDGQVITGNHRVQGFKDFSQKSRATYQSAIKDRFGIELADDELLLRMPTKDLSTKELLSIAYNSNKEDIKNLGDHIYSVLGRYAPNFDKLPRQLESTSVQELKSKIAKILDPSPYPNENDTNLALLAHTIKADKNANITEMLNAFSKLDKEDADKTLQTFTDTAGLWHILSNNAVEYGLKQLDLRPYLLGAMYKAATSLRTTRAANFKELNEQIKHIIDTTDSSGSNMMLEMMPNTYDNLIADLLGASLARFMRLENPSGSLYESLGNTHKGLEAQLAPRIDFFSETGFTQGKNISQADIFDFIEYMIKQGEAGSEVAQAVELLPKLREKYTAFKGEDSALGLESQAGKHNDPTPPTPQESPKVDSSLSQEIKDIIDSSPEKGRDMQIIGEANFTPQVVEYAHKNNKKVAIDKLDKAEAEQLGFKHPSDVRVTIDYQAINHTLNRHGADSPLVQQSGQKAVDYNDIAKYRSIVKGADEKLFSKDDLGQDVILSFKQINGHSVVVENIRKKGNELAFKSMYFENGSYKNSNAYKNAVDSQKADPSPAPYGYEPHADASTPPKVDADIIPQPQMPTDLKDPIKTIEYFKKDLLELKRFFDQDMGGRLKPTPQEYLQAIVGKTIQAQEKLLARAKDELETTLDNTIKHYDRHNGTQDFKAFADKDIKTIMDYIIKFDVEKSHKNARDFFTLMQESEKNIDINPLSWGAIKNYRQDVLEIFQTKLADHEAQTQKWILAQKLKDKLKDPNSQEYKLIQDITEPSTAQKADSSGEATPPQKRLFDEADSSPTPQAQPSSRADEIGAAIHKEAPQETPKVDSTLPYTDTQGHTHQIPTDLAQKWLESFGLKDLQESYTPKFSEQVAQALEPILQGEQITLSANSLVKLIQRDRAEFLPYIKETLEIPNAVVRQVDGAIIFAKDYRDEKLGKFFASVSKNDKGEWVISSNAPKNLNNLQNKIKEGGEVLYSDLPELPIIAKPDLTAKALNSEASQGEIIPQAAQEKPKWSKADQKAWKAAKLAETRAKAQELQAKLQPIYDEVRPLVIQARKLEKPYKEKGKKLPPKVEKQVNELLAKVSESITPKQKPFEAELEKHGLRLNRTDFLHYPESGSIQVTPKQNSNLKWKNKERGEQGLKGSAKYREQALEKLSEKSYIDRLEPATKAQNPLTQLHGLKYEILKDLYKAKRYTTQGGVSYETYARYASRASDELDIIEQAIRELKNAIVPKPKRAELVRSKVQDFIKWRDEVRFDVDYLLGLESDGTRHALEYLRDLPTPTKHHASFVKDLQEQIHKHFDTDPTPPTPPSTPTPQDTPKVDSTQNAQSVATPQAAKPTPPTQAQKIPEQDLPHHAEKELYKELESLKPLKRELTQLRESGEWRSKQGRARRKELDEKIKEAEARGITSTQIQTKNAKNYEKFLSKYGDMEYFKELAQESRDKYIQGLQKDIDNYDASKTAPTPNGIIFTKQSLENILESTREQELDIAGQIWEIAHSMVKLREGAIYKQTDEKIGEFYTKERGKIQKALGIKPIAEFGENYAEYYRDGAGAIEKLLAEKKGQVAGAFYRKELGDIDLVWGEVTGSGKEAKGYGLAKIIEKHGDEFQDIAKELDEIIRDGEVVKRAGRDEAYNIEYNGFKVGINKGFNKQGENKWIVTAFDDSVEKTAKTAPASDSTKETDLSLNSSDIVAQDLQETPNADSNAILQSAMKKFSYDEKKAKDLLEWHKDSSPLTKDENGLPKVFYHYTHTGISHTNGAKRDVNFEAFVRRTTLKDKYDAFKKYDKGSQVHNFGSRWGIFFTENDDYAKRYGKLVSKIDLDVETLIERKEAKAYKVFLNIKNPFNLDTIITKENAQEFYELFKVKNPTKRMREININDYLGKEVGDYVIDLGYTEYITKFENEVLYKKDANGAHFGQRDVLNLADHLSLKGYDGLILSKRHFIQNKPIFRLEFVVFNPNQIKHIENRGVESESGRKYFNDSSPNIFHSNQHLGAGLLGGSVAGIEQDENGQWRFSPEKFALGLLGGVAGSIAISKAHKKFLQSKPQKIIPFINKQKSIPPRFEVTKELEKTYRNAQVKPSEKIKDTLGLSGAIKGDFIKLAQKHPEYFANPQEAKDLCDYVFQNAFIGLQASDKKQALIIAKLQDSSNNYGSVAFRVQNINGEHRIRSVMLMEQKQVDIKVENAKKLGEPIFQFW